MISIQSPKDCCGCEACVASCPKQCISMQENDEGFLYPVVDASLCVRCGLCNKICPIENKPQIADRLPEPEIYAAWSHDEGIRRHSSSGGIFSVLAEGILAENGMVVGAAYTDNWRKVEHIIVEARDGRSADISPLRGSKYVQSEVKPEIYQKIKRVLLDRRKVLFSGTPCQVAALRNYLGKDYPELYTCDLVCHGVPSPGWYRKYIDRRELEEKSPILSINMRNKRSGWVNFGVREQFENGNVEETPMLRNAWLCSFLKNYTLRYSCYACTFATMERVGDITLADFWGLASDPKYNKDDRGLSQIHCNTQRGKKLFLTQKSRITQTRVEIDKATLGQDALVKPCKCPSARKTFLQKAKTLPLSALQKKYKLRPPTAFEAFSQRVSASLRRKINRLTRLFGK